MANEDVPICSCEICGEPIYYGDDFYDMPNGQIVCNFDFDCLSEWAKVYLRR